MDFRHQVATTRSVRRFRGGLSILAVGRADEDVVLEELAPDGNIKYWRDADGRHHVPKRALAGVIFARHTSDKE